jgi:hypothetical protein
VPVEHARQPPGLSHGDHPRDRLHRVAFLVVVTALLGRVGWDLWTGELRPFLG